MSVRAWTLGEGWRGGGAGTDDDPNGGRWWQGIFIENDKLFHLGVVALEQCSGIDRLVVSVILFISIPCAMHCSLLHHGDGNSLSDNTYEPWLLVEMADKML